MSADRPRVLVVEDDFAFRELIATWLGGAGCDVSAAADGHDAQRLIESSLEHQRPFHLLVTDIQMPRVSGIDLLAWVKAEDIRLSVIVMTGLGDALILRRARVLGAVAVLTKPFTRAALCALVSLLVPAARPDPDQSGTHQASYVRSSQTALGKLRGAS